MLRAIAAVAAVLGLAAPFSTAALAQAYPSKALRFVVPFAPAGSTDIFARLIGERLAIALGQPVVIENRAGNGGNIGADAVAKSPPDGHTLLMATTGVMAINNALYKSMSFDAAKDLEPVIFVASITNALVVPADSELKSVGDLLSTAKAAPGKLSFASSGAGSSTHMSGELFKLMSGVDLLHVPYKGSGQAMPDVISGRVSMMFENMPGAVSYINAGKLRILAVTGPTRNAAMPQVPTVAEAGLVGFESIAGQGLFVPAGTPRDIVQKLNSEVNAIIKSPELTERWTQMGIDRVEQSPEQFASWLAKESDQWAVLIRTHGIKPE